MRRIGIALAVTLLWPVLSLHAQIPPPPADIAPAVVVTVPSGSLGSGQIATILLPASYAQSSRRYPVLYLLHGGGQDHTAFATRSWFRALASREMIVVTPGVGDSWYVNSAADPKAKYEDFVVKDLVEFVDSRYRTVASREGRAVAGVSMGAWGAMLLGLKHPESFGAINPGVRKSRDTPHPTCGWSCVGTPRLRPGALLALATSTARW